MSKGMLGSESKVDTRSIYGGAFADQDDTIVLPPESNHGTFTSSGTDGGFSGSGMGDDGFRDVPEGAEEGCCVTPCQRWSWGLGIGSVLAVLTAIGVMASFRFRHGSECTWDGARLPTSIMPSDYQIDWEPEFVAPFNFRGSVLIRMAVNDDSQCLVLHTAGLTWTGAEINESRSGTDPVVSPQSTYRVGISQIKFDEDRQLAFIPLRSLARSDDQLSLHVSFEAPLGRNMNGLYLAQYNKTTEAGKEVTEPIIATQFEATYARHAFPCFDEPSFKAKFQVTARGIPPLFEAMCNMPITSTEQRTDGNFDVYFDESVPMSSYLVAFVAGKFVKVESAAQRLTPDGQPTGETFPVRVLAPETYNSTDLEFALDVAVGCLEYFQKLFGTPYPLPKQDLVAIPDFAAGAMENWGLITYRLTALIADQSSASAAELLRVAVVVSHELVHQTAGDLVTANWWGSLFLNEGYATLFEFYGVNATKPEYNVFNGFVPGDFQSAMRTDSSAATHPLVRPDVDTAAEIEEMFDDISYAKGGTIIRMARQMILDNSPNGEAAFTAGLQTYFQRYSFKNANADQMWEAVFEGAGLPELAPRMGNFTHAPGVPLVVFSIPGDKGDGSNGIMQVSQTRFYRSRYTAQQSRDASLLPRTPDQKATGYVDAGPDQLWYIPVDFRTQSGTGEAHDAGVAMRAQGGFATPTWNISFAFDLDTDGYIHANRLATAYCRVSYTASIWRRIKQVIVEKQVNSSDASAQPDEPFTQAERSQMVDDVFSVAFAGQSPSGLEQGIPDALEFMEFMQLETARQVWLPALSWLYSLADVVRAGVEAGSGSVNQVCVDNTNAYARHLLLPLATALGWESNAGQEADPERPLLRSSALQAADTFGIPWVRVDAAEKWATTGAGLDSDILPIVARSVVRWGDRSEWESVKSAYEQATAPGTKNTLLRALAVTQNPVLLQETLDYSIGPNVRSGDTVSVIVGVASNPLGGQMAWDFFKANFALFNERYGSGGFAAASLVSATASAGVTQDFKNDVVAFFKANPFPAANLEIQRSLESVEARAEALTDSIGGACTWLESWADSQ